MCIRISFISEDLHIVVPSSWSSTTSIQHCRSSSYMIVIVLFFFLSIYLSPIFSSMSFLSWRVLFFRPSNQPNKKPTNQIIKTLATKAVSRSGKLVDSYLLLLLFRVCFFSIFFVMMSHFILYKYFVFNRLSHHFYQSYHNEFIIIKSKWLFSLLKNFSFTHTHIGINHHHYVQFVHVDTVVGFKEIIRLLLPIIIRHRHFYLPHYFCFFFFMILDLM